MDRSRVPLRDPKWLNLRSEFGEINEFTSGRLNRDLNLAGLSPKLNLAPVELAPFDGIWKPLNSELGPSLDTSETVLLHNGHCRVVPSHLEKCEEWVRWKGTFWDNYCNKSDRIWVWLPYLRGVLVHDDEPTNSTNVSNMKIGHSTNLTLLQITRVRTHWNKWIETNSASVLTIDGLMTESWKEAIGVDIHVIIDSILMCFDLHRPSNRPSKRVRIPFKTSTDFY